MGDVILRFRCFGVFESWFGLPPNDAEREIAFGRGRRLIQFLVAHYDRPVQFDALTDAIWPERDSDSSVHRLHQLVSVARAELRAAIGDMNFIPCHRGSYGWGKAVQIESDLPEFVKCFKEGTVAAFERALRLYRGPFMAGEHIDWVVAQRSLYASMYSSMLERAAREALDSGNCASALLSAKGILESDPTNEEGARLVMECYARMGHTRSALTEYDLLERHLRRLLNVEPTEEIRAFRERILEGKLRP